MRENERSLYIGSAVAIAPEEFKQDIVNLRELLTDKGFIVLEYIGDNPANPQEVFEHDISCVVGAEVFVAECTYPSTGLGYEIATALSEGNRVYAFAREGVKISRLVEGIQHENYSFHRYENIDEIVDIVV